MIRYRSLQVALVLVGLLFLAGIYPLLTMKANPGEQMLGVVYVTLGLFLVLAVRNPAANRSLIAFTAWSSLTHAGIMAWQALHGDIPRHDLVLAVPPLAIIGVVLIVLAPSTNKESAS